MLRCRARRWSGCLAGWRSLQRCKDGLITAVLVVVASSCAILGIALQIAPASQADVSRMREAEALLASLKRADTLCSETKQPGARSN